MRQISLFDEVFLEDGQKEKECKKNWLLIDGNNLMNRAYYATANNIMSAPDGTPQNYRLLFNY